MKHLVLGSAGQIGRHLVSVLKQNGEEVIEYDIELDQNQDLRFYFNPGLDDAMESCDIVHFLAFDVGGAKYLEKYQNTYEFLMNNIQIMLNTFEYLQTYNKPFIFSSSQMGYVSDSTYGRLKMMGEDITRSLGGLYVKFWNVYGNEEVGEKSHVITDFIEMAKQGKIQARTDGTEHRQFLYADDCAECMLELAKNYSDIDRDKPLHITNFKWHTIKDVANIIQTISDCEVEFTERKDQTQKDNKVEPNPYILNFWTPKTTLEEGIKKLYK